MLRHILSLSCAWVLLLISFNTSNALAQEGRLWRLLEQGKVAQAKQLLKRKPKLVRSKRVLQWAAYGRHPDVVDFLLKRGAIADESILEEAARRYAEYQPSRQHREKARQLLKVCTLLLSAGAKGNIRVAIYLNEVGRIRVLVKQPKLAKDPHALVIAAQYGREAIVKLFLDHGAGPGDKVGPASRFSIKHPKILSLLLKAGADPNIRFFEDGFLDPNILASTGDPGISTRLLHESVKENYLASVKLLLVHGAAIDSRDEKGNTPLHVAAAKARVEIARLLVSKNAGLDLKNKSGQTAMAVAADWIRPDLKLNPAEKKRNSDFRTVVQLLIDSGELTTVFVAVALGRIASVKSKLGKDGKLVRSVVGRRAFRKAVVLNDEKIADVFIKSGVNVNARDAWGWTALHSAISAGHMKMVRLLIANKANVNVGDKWGRTALHTAIYGRHTKMARFLIANKADVNAADSEHSTPLHYAAQHSNPSIARGLLKGGASVNVKNNSARTALHYAAQQFQVDIVRALLDHGARLDLTDKGGRTPLGIAKRWRYSISAKGKKTDETIKLLMERGK